MERLLFLFANSVIFCYGIQIRTKYSEYAPDTVPNGLFQEISNTVYLDGKAANTLIEPQYITTMEEIKYRKHLNEDEIISVFNFRNLNLFSMVNNTQQKKIPNFRNLPKMRKIQIKTCNITKVTSTSLSNINVEVLDLQKNLISEIEKGAFGRKVHTIDLKCNFLTSISPNWFRNVSNLEWLNLESNRLKSLQENLFQKFISLRELYLARNEITILEPRSIAGPINMYVLDLGLNDISIINSDVFNENNTVYITNIRISFNRLSFISDDLMDKITIKNNSVIYGNPWQCPCVKKIRDWLPAKNVNYTIRNEPSCVFTIEKSKKCIEEVNLNDELYNYYISNFDIVDSRTCSVEGTDYNPVTRERMLFYKWFDGNIDLRRR